MKISFFHGMESSPQGTKSRLLRQHYPDCWIPELPPDIYKRLEIITAANKTPLLIIGSSLGGLTAIMYAMQSPDRVKGLVLLAPAVGSHEDTMIQADREKVLLESLHIPKQIPTAIIAAIKDELIPLAAVRALVHRSPQTEMIELYEVDDDHMLHQSLDLMLDVIKGVEKRVSSTNLTAE